MVFYEMGMQVAETRGDVVGCPETIWLGIKQDYDNERVCI